MAAEYTIQGGDYWFKIAKDLGININELLKLNNLSMADVQGEGGKLSVGQTIKIPRGEPNKPIGEIDRDQLPFQRPPSGEVIDHSRDTLDNEETETYDPYSDPIADYMDDPAYSAFMAQYNLSKGDIEDVRDMTRSNLLGGLRRQLGELTDPNADPFNINAERAGGEFGLARNRQFEQNLDQFAGRGMGFSGGRRKEAAKIRTDWASREAELEQQFVQGLGQADQQRTSSSRQLEMQKIQAEQEAYQRRIDEEIRAKYG